MCSTRRKEPSTPSKQFRLAPYVVIVMRLAVLLDIIAIAARIAIILLAADHRADDSAEDRAGDRASARPDTRKDRTRDSAGTGADRCARRFARDHVVGLRVGCAAAKREAACNSG